MKNCFFGVLCLLLYQVSIAQENFKNFDFIVCVDEEIATSISRPVIIAKLGKNLLKDIDLSYHPGNLSMSLDDYNVIFSDQDINLTLQFDYYQYPSFGNQKIYNYIVEIDKKLFEKKFVVLKIYNLDKKKYKKIKEPLSKDKNYTFDLETSDGQILRINKK